MTTSHRSPRLMLLVLLAVFGLLSRAAAQSAPDKSSHPTPAGWNIRFDGSGSRPALADGILYIYIGSADGAFMHSTPVLDSKSGVFKQERISRFKFNVGDFSTTIHCVSTH